MLIGGLRPNDTPYTSADSKTSQVRGPPTSCCEIIGSPTFIEPRIASASTSSAKFNITLTAYNRPRSCWTLLFKIFNKIETWELLERVLGPISWQSINIASIDTTLDDALRRNARIYSAAYIMPSPAFGHSRKHSNHLALLASMMDDDLPARIQKSRSLRQVYELLRPYPGLGPFLAFQYAIDLNYSRFLDFNESDFVIAGPGALDGIAKCFGDLGRTAPEEVIYAMVDRQEPEFGRLSLSFNGLYGRRLQPIDCQNIFCEISKYARVTHPEVRGTTERKRIKQSYRPAARALSTPTFPPRWNLIVPSNTSTRQLTSKQLQLF
jgi:hypothetical protein